MKKNKLILIEDELKTSEWIAEYLTDHDFLVDTFATVGEAASYLLNDDYDLVLLDLSLSDNEGFELLKFLSKNKIFIPTIIISAFSDKFNKLKAFNLGAIDYMVKPIILEELEVRIWIQLRNTTTIDLVKESSTFEIHDETIFFEGAQLQLRKMEFDILKYLITRKNQVVSRESLTENVKSISSNRSLDYHISNLRKKIGDDAINPKYLITEYGYGYKLVF